MRKYIALTIGTIILVVVSWFGSQPPSDKTVIGIYREHHDRMNQLVQLYHEDQVGVIVHKNGSIYPKDATAQLSSDRLGQYKKMVKEIGVTRSMGGNAEGLVTLQIFNLIPLSPMKTLEFSPTPPPLITFENTDDYTFTPGEYKRVCRYIEDVWYLCLDYED